MKKIAILACLKSNSVCAGCACLNALHDRRSAFECYKDEEVQLTAFARCSHCVDEMDPMEDPGFIEKAERFVQEGIEVVHIGICARKNGEICSGMQTMMHCLEEKGIKVVWGTHRERRS